jgi:excisionase family DNA binding protein
VISGWEEGPPQGLGPDLRLLRILRKMRMMIRFVAGGFINAKQCPMVVAQPIGVIEPTAHLSRAAKRAREVVAEAVRQAPEQGDASGTVRIEQLELSRPLVQMLIRILDDLSAGHAVAVHTIADGEEEVTTSKAAHILGMSRPTLIDLLEKGEIPYRLVGTHRRVPVLDLLTYKMRMRRGRPAPSRAEKLRALEEMADYTDRLGLGY